MSMARTPPNIANSKRRLEPAFDELEGDNHEQNSGVAKRLNISAEDSESKNKMNLSKFGNLFIF